MPSDHRARRAILFIARKGSGPGLDSAVVHSIRLFWYSPVLCHVCGHRSLATFANVGRVAVKSRVRVQGMCTHALTR